MPTPQELMAALARLAPGGGAGPSPMGFPGMGGGPGPGGPPMGGMPGLGGPGPAPMPDMSGMNQTAQMGLSALDGVVNQDRNGTVAIDRIKNALNVVQRLISAVLPQINARGLNPQVYKDLHIIGRQVADASLNLEKQPEPGPPPESFMMGIQGTGLPGA